MPQRVHVARPRVSALRPRAQVVHCWFQVQPSHAVFHGASVQVASAGSVKKPKKNKGELVDFYHFQQHEKKREQLLKLREQFEADKARIAKMKSERKFKPAGY